MGAGVGGPGRSVRGHCEVKGIFARGRGAGVRGCLGAGGGRQAGGKLEKHHGLLAGAVGAPWAAGPREAASGGRRSRQTRGCEGPRGVYELGSRGAQTPPRCEPRLWGGGRPGPPSASHRRRRRRLPGLPGLPGPRNAAAVAGGAAWRGGGRDRRRPCPSATALLPCGGPCRRVRGKSDGNPELSGACSTPPLPEMSHHAACSSSQEPGLGFRSWCHLSPSEWPRAQRLTLLGQSILLSSGVGGGRGGITVILCGAG